MRYGEGAAYEDINVLAQRAVGVRFDDFLEGGAGVEGRWHCVCFCRNT